jgi:hypothetical protein
MEIQKMEVVIWVLVGTFLMALVIMLVGGSLIDSDDRLD